MGTHRDNDDQQVVLITGCSAGGIGHFLALEFASHGCKVYASARNTDKLQGLAEHGIESIELDVTSPESVTSAVAHVVKLAGHIDILVNNAGVPCVGPAVEVDMDQVQRAFDTNVFGLTRLCQAVAPHMIKRRRGTIVNVGSVVGYVATPWAGFYSSTKAAVHALSDAMRMELAPFGVHVVVVAPGGIKSNIATHTTITLPEGSSYEPALEAIRARAEYSQTGNSTPTDEFARVVISQILVPKPRPYITYGANSLSVWLAYYYPPVLRDSVLAKKFGTQVLAQPPASGGQEEGGVCPVSGKAGGQCPVGLGAKEKSGSRANARSGGGCPVANPVTWIGLALACAATYAWQHL
ncbi:NAD(P)-binding protein [Martensiomyces pterosporus]|nr:NAD(P)-binding protein [Martensiomyces pterosporus]